MTDLNTGIDLTHAAAVAFFVSTAVLGVATTIATRKLHDARCRIENLTSDLKWFRAEADKFARRGQILSAELEAYKSVAAADKSASAKHTVTRNKRPARPVRVATDTNHNASANRFSDGGLAISSVSAGSGYSSSSCDSSSSSSSSSSSCD